MTAWACLRWWCTSNGRPSKEDSRSGAGKGGGAGGFQEFGSVGANVSVGEDGAARDEELGAGFDDIAHCFAIDSSIHFNTEIEFAFRAHACEGGNFVKGVGDEFLAAEPGIHAHHQDVVNKIEHFGQGFDGSSGIENYARLAAVGSNQVERAIKMNAGFLVDGHPVGSSFREYRDEKIGIFDHEMAIEWDFEMLAEGADDRRTDGEIGDKVTIHDVEMEDGGAAV